MQESLAIMKIILKKYNTFLTLLSLFLVLFLNTAFAAQVSQAQIEQFKRLPASQQ